jgi:hypothetical protein
MPLHQTGLVSRRELDNPEEKPHAEPLPFEHVLKYNPHHDKRSGRFTSGGKGSDPTGGRHIQGLSERSVYEGAREYKAITPATEFRRAAARVSLGGRALDASVSGPATPEAAHIRRQAHTSFQTKSGQKHVLNPAKTTFRI